MATLSEEVPQVREEGITKVQNEKLSRIAMPTAWHVKSGSLEWLDEGLGDRILLLEKNIEQKTASEDKASSEHKISHEKYSDRINNSAKYRQLYRIALYNGPLLKDDKDKEITGQKLVLFFRVNDRIARKVPYTESGKDLNFGWADYNKCFSGLYYIPESIIPGVHFLNMLIQTLKTLKGREFLCLLMKMSL